MFTRLLLWIKAHAQQSWFGVLLTLCIVHSIGYVWNSTIWSPQDELNHYDYIYNLAHYGKKANANDYIDQALFNYTQQNLHIVSPSGTDRSIAAYGITTKSYEAHQPPVYYGVMAIFEKTLSYFPIEWKTRIQLLRVISVLFLFSGLVWGYKALNLIRLQTGSFSTLFMHTVLLFTSLFLVSDKYGLSNDHFSFPVVTYSFYQLVIWHYRQSSKYLYTAILFAVLAVLVKYTNLLYLAGILVFWMSKWSLKTPLSFYLKTASPLLLIPLCLIYNRYVMGQDLLNVDSTLQLFNVIQAGTFSTPVYLKILFQDWLSPVAYGLKQFAASFWIILFLLTLSFFYLILQYEKLLNQNAILSVSLLFTIGIILSGAYLNAHVGGVFWFSMRLYSGYFLFFNIALFSCFTSRHSVLKKMLQAIYIGCGLPLLYDFIM